MKYHWNFQPSASIKVVNFQNDFHVSYALIYKYVVEANILPLDK